MQSRHTNSRRFAAVLLRCIGISLAFTFAAFSGLALADPPTRVARLGYLSGAISFSPAGETSWVAGTLNRPLVTGDRLWADDRGRVELQIGSAMVRLGARTSFTLTNLDDRIAQMNLQDGTIQLRVRRMERNQVVEVDTPNLAFVIRQEGEYRITVDAARGSTEVRTRSGRADVFGKGASYTIGLGRAYRFYGAGLTDYEVLTMPRADEFERWCQGRDRRYETSTSARYVSRDVIGYQDLDQYGSWRSSPQYGNVWTPTRVASNWAPYRDGHWSWVEPWGWTWVDDLPWGFAVSHYGRWINDAGRWGWIPGPAAARAVYAPALVAFIGGSNFQVSAASGNVGAVGWFPLGPREVYRPAYAVSREYFTNVNISNTVINNTTIINNYDNRGATTVVANTVYVNQSVPGAIVAVPTTTFVQAQPVARAAIRVSEAALMAAPVIALAAVAPVQSSLLGAAAPRAMPPQVVEQRFVAQSQPPAAAVPFAVRQRALAVNPGKPVEAAVLATLTAPAAPLVRGTPGNAGSPPAAVVAPRVDLVPDTRTAGAAVVAPPPRAPGDRSGSAEQRAPQSMPPAAQAQPAPSPAAAPAIAVPGGRPPPPVAPDVARPGNRPVEALGRPVTSPPVPPAPAATAPPPIMSTSPGNPAREQRETPQARVRALPSAQPQAAPPVAPAQPAARAPLSAGEDPSRPGNRPSEAAGRPFAAPPTVQGAGATSTPAPARPGNSGREQREAPPPVAAPPTVQGAGATPPPVPTRPGNSGREQREALPPVAAPPVVSGAGATPPSVPTRPGNSGREQREAPPPSVAPAAPARAMPPPQVPPPVAPSPPIAPTAPIAPVAPPQPAARAPAPPAQDAQRPGNRPSEAPGRPVLAPPAATAPAAPAAPAAPVAPPAPAPAPAPAARPAPVIQPPAAVAPPASARPGNSGREQRDAPPVAPAAQAAPPAPARLPPAARPPQPPAPAVEPGVRAPVETQPGRPERSAARPQPAPPPAAAARPGEPPAAAAPPKPGNGDKRPRANEEKKGEKEADDGNPQPDDKERKRR